MSPALKLFIWQTFNSFSKRDRTPGLLREVVMPMNVHKTVLFSPYRIQVHFVKSLNKETNK